jgi:glycosyltransferase involved in cell wall biosynthesis
MLQRHSDRNGMNQIEKISMQAAVSTQPPRLSIGLPVFNGEQYLAKALDSLLGQTFTDFELVISDNASTDATRQICEEYAARDARIRYHRNQKNIGAMQNWYHSFQLSRGEYFLGAAHDDVFHFDFVRRCIEELDANPEAVVCYTWTKVIDEDGHIVKDFVVPIDTTSLKPHIRLYNVISIDYLCIQLLGVMRSTAFGATKPFAGYYGCDRNALAELSILGPILEVPEFLFYHRLHPQALGAAKNSGRSHRDLQILDPGIDWNARFPTLTRFINYFRSNHRLVSGFRDRLLCDISLVRIVFEKTILRIVSGSSASRF